MDTEKEVIPPLSLGGVVGWRKKIKAILTPHLNSTLVGNSLQQLTASISDLLYKPVTTIDGLDLGDDKAVGAAVYKTLAAHALGKQLDEKLFEKLVTIVAGNIDRLKAGGAVTEWMYQLQPEWVLAIIRDNHHYVTPRQHIHGTMLVFEILTGVAASKYVSSFFTDPALRRLSIRIGAIKKRDRRALHPHDFVRLYVLVHLKKGEKLEIERYKEKASLASRNALRIKKRKDYRKVCPKQSTVPCSFCPTGYSVCAQGTHQFNCVLQQCKNGHSGWVNTRHPQQPCLMCQYNAWKSRYGGVNEEVKGSDSQNSKGTAGSGGEAV